MEDNPSTEIQIAHPKFGESLLRSAEGKEVLTPWFFDPTLHRFEG
jgi:hypothetical protein